MYRTLLLFLLCLPCAHAAEIDPKLRLKEVLASRLGEVTQVNTSPIAGLYEVVTPGRLFYVDESGQYLLDGELFDLKTRHNITKARSQQLFAIQFDKLPFELAIKKVKGKGSRKLAYFTDPNCRYCKALERELRKVDNLTVYLFLYPVLEGSAEKVRAVWCSKDRADAWDKLMSEGVLPVPGKCDAPTDKVIALAAKHNVNGTPALVFANGVIVPGYMPAAELEKALESNR
jgi:thiol:disulfide interchange protein DsbC